MQVSVEAGEGLERRMTVELPADQVDAAVTQRLKKIGRTARIDGFRPGKVPLNILRKYYGGQVLQEVYGQLVETSYSQAIEQEKLKPAGMPKIEPKVGEDETIFSYVATLEVMPEIEQVNLGGSLKRPVAEVTDADVDNMVDKLRQQRVTWNAVERPSANGDQVKINFKGTIEGEPFKGGSADDVPLVLGSKSMIEGFEEGLVGMVKAETRTLELKFPEDYRVKDLAGKQVSFHVEVNEVAEPVLPEVDEAFAKEFGADEGVDKLKADIRVNMQRELRQRIKDKVKAQAMNLILEHNQIVVPKALVEEEIEALRKQARSQISGKGTFELPRELFEENAKRRVTLGLLIAEIIKQNKLELDNERVRKTIEDYAMSYEHPEAFVDHYLKNKELMSSVRNIVLEDQVVDWVVDQVKVEDDVTSFAALTQQA